MRSGKKLFRVLADGVGGRPAGNEDLNDGVAAEAVAAMDASCHLAGSVEAWDDVAFGIQHMTVHIHFSWVLIQKS